MSKILLVEDDSALGSTLSERLRQEGYLAVLAASKSEAERLLFAENGKFDLVIPDIGLPDGSGMDLARDIRFKSNTPLVFLTAMTSAEFRLEGFEIGAEDYIPKPFHLKELRLRVERVLTRVHSPVQFVFKGFQINPESKGIEIDGGDKIHPAPRDFDVLRYLITFAPRVISRNELLQQFWLGDTDQSGRTVDNTVMRLRQHLEPLAVECIRSVRGVGYQWMVERVS